MPIALWFRVPDGVEKCPFSEVLKAKIRKFVRRIQSVTEIPLDVEVHVIPAMLIPHTHDLFASGACYYDQSPIIIHVAASPETPVDEIYMTIAHEIVHVEQVRDKRKVTERGVAVRARNLVRKAMED